MDFRVFKKILGVNFIGPDELEPVCKKLRIISPKAVSEKIPEIIYSSALIKANKDTHVLFLGIPFHTDHSPVSLISLRNLLGTDPAENEPCFYNQDWYLKEPFASATFPLQWYFMKKDILDETRGADTNTINALPDNSNKFPPAILTAYFFFLYYFHTGHIAFKHDYVWNADLDSNGDRIYVGKYIDPLGINKNGFEIHRHLSIKPNYGAISFFE